jgi:anaerobic selenocysteine-containing dehydrogenase
MIHPEDAARRGLADGELARVRSRVGSVDVPVEVTDDVMAGVVSIPHGWGHDRPGARLATAIEHAGVSLNDLTDDLAVDSLSGNAAFSGVPVWVERSSPAG